MIARGGWINTIHGNLEFLEEDKAKWLARVQKIYGPLQAMGRTKTFGGIPGEIQPYGFGSLAANGAIYTVVNPAQSVQELALPLVSRAQEPLGTGRIIFRDAGFAPILNGNKITLGPGEMAAVGFGQYALKEFDLGFQEDVRIPKTIALLSASFVPAGRNTIESVIPAPAKGDIRILFEQRDKDGNITRSWPGGPPNSASVGKVLKIEAEQDGKPLPIEINYDKQVWSGLSWGAGEIRHGDFVAGHPLRIRCSSGEKDTVQLAAQLYSIEY
jgi:hypothetical protein